MKFSLNFAPAILAGALFLGQPTFAADPDNGADLFDSYCSDCHSVAAKVANRKGPSLYRVAGRKAGAVPGFTYSPAMLASNIIWNPAALNAYLANPKAVLPTGIMKFKGMPKPADRADVIAYLATLR
jgi:cytochrome c